MSDILSDLKPLLREGRLREAESLISDKLEVAPHELDSLRVELANILPLTANWALMARLRPPRENWLLASGWLTSLAHRKPVDKSGGPIPWWTYPAIDWVAQRIRKTHTVFEWGAGNSTLWLAGRAASVCSVEHDPTWVADLQRDLPANATLLHRDLDDSYESAISQFAGTGGDKPLYDIIVIDGRRRVECARRATACLKPNGFLILDNSDVEAHCEGIDILERSGFHRLDLFGLIPCYIYKNCTSVFFRDPAVLNAGTRPAAHVSPVGPTVDQTQIKPARQ